MILEFTGELCVMTLKNDAKVEKELTCQFKTDMRNLTNFDPSTRRDELRLMGLKIVAKLTRIFFFFFKLTRAF